MKPAAVRKAIIGVGNEYRGDDAAGILAARRLRSLALRDVQVLEHGGEGTSLLDLLGHYDEVILVDAVSSGSPAGTLHRFDADTNRLPRHFRHASSHAVGIADAIELGRITGTLPSHVSIIGIEGADFSQGAPCSAPVLARIESIGSLPEFRDFSSA